VATAYGASSGVALHAKAIVVDSRYSFVGSMNMDQRSKLLNTEMGVIVDCPALAQAIAEYFRNAVAPGSAASLQLSGSENGRPSGDIQWVTEEDGKPVVLDSEPGATAARKLEVSVLKLLPIDGLL
jgi:putative cardiolipin synthase